MTVLPSYCGIPTAHSKSGYIKGLTVPITSFYAANGYLVGERNGPASGHDYLGDGSGSITAAASPSDQSEQFSARFHSFGFPYHATTIASAPAFQWQGQVGSKATSRWHLTYYAERQYLSIADGRWSSPHSTSYPLFGYSYAPAAPLVVTRYCIFDFSECGVYSARFSFKANRSGGYLIQQIAISQTVKNCNDNPVSSRCAPPSDLYYEAIELGADGESCETDDWSPIAAFDLCTHGKFTVSSSLTWVRTLPSNFKPGNVFCAGSFPSARSYQGTFIGKMSITLDWGCCSCCCDCSCTNDTNPCPSSCGEGPCYDTKISKPKYCSSSSY